MKQAAYLVGIRQYREYVLKGVSNDLALVAQGLRRHGYPEHAIHILDDTHSTLAGLHSLLSRIRSEFAGAAGGSCLLYMSAGGALSLDPLRGGVLPGDGLEEDFRTALSFDELNLLLPTGPGLRVSFILDT